MAQITEDYVSYETAKLLKEKGFDENTSVNYFVGDDKPRGCMIGEMIYHKRMEEDTHLAKLEKAVFDMLVERTNEITISEKQARKYAPIFLAIVKDEILKWVKAEMERLWELLPDADNDNPTKMELRYLGQYMQMESLESFLETL